jgi:AAA15 family ATPase/GTPase
MQLTHFKISKYRNILDSEWIEVNKITAFVGQNEAGKSNLFEALYRINPFVPNETYNIIEHRRAGQRIANRADNGRQ